jgi:hypothetical protein
MPQLLCHSGKEPPWYPLNRGMGGLQNWSGQFGEDKISSLNGNKHNSLVVHQHFQAKIRSTHCNTAKEKNI